MKTQSKRYSPERGSVAGIVRAAVPHTTKKNLLCSAYQFWRAMHPGCCFAYKRFFVSFPHTFRILLLRIYKIVYIGLRRGPNLQDSLHVGSNLQDSFSGRASQSGLLPWGLQIIRIASLRVQNQLKCFLGGSASLAGLSNLDSYNAEAIGRCVCHAAGVGLFSFSHTVRIASAYVSHT